MGEDCTACNALCVLELNECTGLPGGADGNAATTDGITAGPSSSSAAIGGAPAPAVTASPAPQGGTTTTSMSPTATPTAVCGADEEGCVDVDYVIRYCIPVSVGFVSRTTSFGAGGRTDGRTDSVVSSRRRL